jgi:alpha-glucosidase
VGVPADGNGVRAAMRARTVNQVRRRCHRSRPVAALAALLLLAAAAPALADRQAATATGRADVALELPLAGGGRLVVDREPFRVAVLAADGTETVATVAGAKGPPVEVPAADGPQPVDPLGAAGAFPALGFVYGADGAVSFPLPVFTGNRVFGAEIGVVASLVEVTGVERTADGAVLRVRTDAPGLPEATVAVERLPGGGARLVADPPAGPAPISSVSTLASPADEGLYGLGARKDSFDQRGLLRNVWTEEQNASDERVEPVVCTDPTGTTGCDYTFPNGAQAAYFVQTALFGSRGWSAWLGQTELGRYDLAASRDDAIRLGVAAPRLVLHLAGGGLEPASAAFTAGTGRAPAPPTWVYEPWVDRLNSGEGEAAPCGGGFTGGASVQQDIQDFADEAEARDIPLGVIGVEGWHAVPDRGVFTRLRERGYTLAGYWNPFHSPGNACHAEAAARDLFIEDPLGRPYAFVNNRGALTFAIDWTKPGAQHWWTERIGAMHDLGFEGYMHDFGEFVTEGMRFADGTPPETMHNLYPVLLHQAARTASDAWAAAHPGQSEPWFYIRSGHSGAVDRVGGRGATAFTTGTFPGDETTDWAQGSGLPSVVPAMLNLALGGAGTFSTDVGGYFDFVAPRTTPELFARWSQLAALTPTMRVHNSTDKGSVYPWTVGPEAEDVFRRYAKLKLALAPMVDQWAQQVERTGVVGPVRPLVLDDPSPAARSVDDQWLLGRELLVAPVLEPGATSREVYLPAGSRWQQVVVDDDGALQPLGKPLDGGRTTTAAAPLADIPLFARVGGAAPAAAVDAVPAARAGEQATTAARLPATGPGAGAGAAVLLMVAAAALRRRRATSPV